MSHPNPTHEAENESPEDEMSSAMSEIGEDAAFHWNKILELTDAIGLQVKDLNDQLREFNNNPLFPHLN